MKGRIKKEALRNAGEKQLALGCDIDLGLGLSLEVRSGLAVRQ